MHEINIIFYIKKHPKLLIKLRLNEIQECYSLETKNRLGLKIRKSDLEDDVSE